MSYALILNCNCLLCHANVLFMSIHLSIDMWTSGLNSFRKAPSNPRVCVPYWSEPAMILAVELFPFSGQICELCAILLYLYPNTYLFTCAVDVYLWFPGGTLHYFFCEGSFLPFWLLKCILCFWNLYFCISCCEFRVINC